MRSHKCDFLNDFMNDHLGKYLGVVSAVLLTLSVLYDYFYLKALGLSFSDVPTTITDHLRSAIIWMPALGIFTFFGFILGASEKPLATDDKPKINLVDIFFILSMISAFVVMTWSSTVLAVTLMGAVLTSFLYLRFKPGFSSLEEKLGTQSAKLSSFIPAFAMIIALTGYTDGALLTSSLKPNWQVVVKTGNAEKTLDLIGIRRFSASAILVKSSTSVSVIDSDTIVTVQSLKESPQLFRCWVSASFCKP